MVSGIRAIVVMATSDNYASIESLLQSTLKLENLSEEAVNNLQKLESLVRTEKQRNQGVLSRFRLDNQVALVTGGSRGIGLALALALGEAGCKVAVASTKLEHSQRAVDKLEQNGIEALALEVDVAKKEGVNEMVKHVLNKWGDLHIAVNNAGICAIGDSIHFPEETWDLVMGINLKGVFLCCQAEGQHMTKKGYGRIINMASMSGHISNFPQGQAAYNASKAGVIQLTKTLAAEWAQTGVTVNSISPGYVETDMLGGAGNPYREDWTHRTPMKRFGETPELQGLTVLLASSLSSYTTGSDVIIDGGYVLW